MKIWSIGGSSTAHLLPCFSVPPPQPFARCPAEPSAAASSRLSASKPEAKTPSTGSDTMWSGEQLSHKRITNVPKVMVSLKKIDVEVEMKNFQTKMNGSISGQSGREILKLFPPFFFLFNLSSYLSLSPHVYIL